MFYDNHIFIHNLRLDDNYRRWSISKSWTLDTSRCSVVAREIWIIYDLHLNTDSFRHSFQHKMEVCYFCVRFLESHMQEYIARSTETIVFSMNHYMDTFPTRLLALWNRSCRTGVSSVVLLYSVRVTNACWILISTSWSAMRTTSRTWPRVVTYMYYTCII